jgi:hypothetical protein
VLRRRGEATPDISESPAFFNFLQLTFCRTNKHIDTMNEKLFKPRGLYAMIMTYKPESTSADEVVDLNQNITKVVGARYDGHGSKLSQSSGKTYSDLQLPQAAPLIFPELDALPEGEKESAFKRCGHFLGDYFDRRAQARFEAENPDLKLNVAPVRSLPLASAIQITQFTAVASSPSPLVVLFLEGDLDRQREEARRNTMPAARRLPRGLDKEQVCSAV